MVSGVDMLFVNKLDVTDRSRNCSGQFDIAQAGSSNERVKCPRCGSIGLAVAANRSGSWIEWKALLNFYARCQLTTLNIVTTAFYSVKSRMLTPTRRKCQ